MYFDTFSRWLAGVCCLKEYLIDTMRMSVQWSVYRQLAYWLNDDEDDEDDEDDDDDENENDGDDGDDDDLHVWYFLC